VLANELGNSLLKYAVKLEGELDNLYENGSLNEYNEDS